jgi:hypothetical protein
VTRVRADYSARTLQVDKGPVLALDSLVGTALAAKSKCAALAKDESLRTQRAS